MLEFYKLIKKQLKMMPNLILLKNTGLISAKIDEIGSMEIALWKIINDLGMFLAMFLYPTNPFQSGFFKRKRERQSAR